MPHINVLPKSIFELIAAGEVVERPASIVKELVENSIDSGAQAISIEIKNGGKSFIRVTDDGCGILHEDVPKAFLSYATSKISRSEDLESIITLGFRGEALPSVAAVSRVQVLTKSPEEDSGTAYEIEGGVEKAYDWVGCPNGTSVIVRDVFFNVPARMKFLKKDVSEGNAVSDIVDKLAISHPDIKFTYIRDLKQIINTPGSGDLRSCVHAVFGDGFSKTLIEASGNIDDVKVSGLISRPLEARGSRAMQFFFINGRYVRSKGLTASFENAYKNALMVGKFPGCVLNIEIPYDSIDVNVHPSKTEVRFSDERKVLSAVYYAAKAAVQSFDKRPSFDVSKIISVPESNAHQMSFSDSANAAERFISKQFYSDTKVFNEQRPEAIIQKQKLRVSEPAAVSNFKKSNEEPDLIGNIADFIKSGRIENEKEDFTYFSDKSIEKDDITFVGEAFKTYIIVEYKGKLCFIDKHAAHERIIFNKLKEQSKSQPSQVLLEPVVITASKQEYDTVMSNLDVFEEAGFHISDFGPGSIAVRQKPMLIDDSDIMSAVLEIADNIYEGKIDSNTDKIDMILHATACKAAIKAGNNNSPEELLKLSSDVIFDDNVRYCPHGRPVLIEMTKYELEKQFRRIQS